MIKLSENGINDYNMCPVIISHIVRNIVLKLIFMGDYFYMSLARII